MEQRSNSTSKGEAPLACQDLLILIAVSILYSIGKDEECGIEAKKLVLIYLIIKACFIFLRCCQCFVIFFLGKFGIISHLIWTVTWITGIIVFYIIVLTNFFSSDNDCKENAINIWVALLIITIEGIAVLSIVAILILILSCILPIFIYNSMKR
ncbi:unnamed protein product [Moneuplotes crassus]|uniref:Uncharacterized protein n=1 Tax=Euplotes crassus TaxID=5936 RepID=A0AAD2D7C9_EUPCR|nr:unnamed protein product [Moneuplotes crassus]